MTQTISYVVDVKGAQAAAGQVEKVEAAFRRTDVAAAQAGKSMDRATGPTRNLGQAGLEASRAFEDLQYGIGGVVNNIPSLVMSLGAGAGVAGAISLAVVAANQLYKAFGNVGDAGKAGADAAAEHMRALEKSIVDADTELQNLILGASMARITAQKMAVEEAASAGKQAQATFRQQFGIDPNDQRAMGRIASQAQGGLDIWVTRWNAQKQEMEKVRVAAKDVMAEYRKVTDAFNTAIDQQVLLRRYEAIEVERIEQLKTDAVIDAANRQEQDFKRRSDLAKKQAEDDARLRYDIYVAGLNDEDKALDAVRKARAADRKKEAQAMAKEFRDMDRERAKVERERERDEKKALREREREHERTMRAMQAAEKRTADYQVGLAEMAVGQMTSALTDYIQAKVAGEEHAEQKAIASFLSATGQQLIASGVRGVFEGAILSANPLTPGAGAGMMLTGGAAIAAGAAMAGGGAAVMASIPQTGSTSPSGAMRDPGASPRTSGGSGGGPLVLNVTYGVAGPLPEDTARAIHRELRSGDRRSGR